MGWEWCGRKNDEQEETPKGIDPNKHILGSLFHLYEAIKPQFLYTEVYYVFFMPWNLTKIVSIVKSIV
jgi:hypothetical protein